MIEVPIKVSQSSKPATHWLIIPERCNSGSGSEFKRGPYMQPCDKDHAETIAELQKFEMEEARNLCL